MKHSTFGTTARLTTLVMSLAISLATSLPAQGTTQYGPFRITAGRPQDIGLYLRKGEYFYVQANGLMQHYNQQHWPNGYTAQNGALLGVLYVNAGGDDVFVGAAGGGYAGGDGTLDLGVRYEDPNSESDFLVTKGSFMVWVTAPAGRCQQLTCGFTNTWGEDLSDETRLPGNVATWSPAMSSVMGAGYQLGNAEVMAANRPNDEETVQIIDTHLRSAHAFASNGQMNPDGIGALLTSLGQSRNPAGLRPYMNATHDAYQNALSRMCVCGGVTMNVSWMWNAGRQLAYVEGTTYLNVTASFTQGALAALRGACVNTGILPVDGIDNMIRMLNAGSQPSTLASAFAGLRDQLFNAANRTCVCY